MRWRLAQVAIVSWFLILSGMNLAMNCVAQATVRDARAAASPAASPGSASLGSTSLGSASLGSNAGEAEILSSPAALPELEQPTSIGMWNAPQKSPPGIAGRGFSFLERFAGDQRAVWTSPFGLRRGDAMWALPALAGAGAFVAGDSWLSKQIPMGEIARSRTLSNYGTFSLAGAAGGMFLFGEITRNDHAAETGFLAGEAAVNALAVDYALKSVFQRQRPYDGTGAGHFFAGGSSFPSEHASVSWAIAGVVAHEYPGTLTKLFSYGLASAVTVARVTGKEHFPSDVVVGGALGYFLAQQIYRRHRDPEISQAAWGDLIETGPQKLQQDKVRNPRHMGSSYLPLDSWAYPALERLAALGYV